MSTTEPNTPAKPAQILRSLVADEIRYETLIEAGGYNQEIEDARNDARSAKESRVLTTPLRDALDIGAQLRVVWGAIGECGYFDPPTDGHEPVLHHLWNIIQSIEEIEHLRKWPFASQ